MLYVVPPGDPALERLARDAAHDHVAEIVLADDPGPVQAALRRLDNAGRVVAAVCLLGDARALPHASLEDETGNDAALLTDNDYGMLEAPTPASRHSALALPDVPVCRIPSTDPSIVGRLLAVRDQLPTRWAPGTAVTCAVWQRSSADTLRQIAANAQPELRTSPPVEAPDIEHVFANPPGRLFFNVHGSDQSPSWFGEGGGRHPEVLHARGVRVAPDAILVSEACYGAAHGAGTDNISHAFLHGGGSAFVGSTIIAWGPAAPPLSLADLIVTGTYGALDSGHTLAEALLAAKAQILAAAEHDGGLSPQVLNTISSFCAFGGPLARVQGIGPKRSIGQPGAGTWAQAKGARLPGPGDVLGRARSGLREGGGEGPLAAARRGLADRAARAGWQPVAREILSTADLPRHFRAAADIQRALHEALGVVPDAMSSVRYTVRGRQETLLMATARTGAVTRRAAVVIDASENVCARLFARGEG